MAPDIEARRGLTFGQAEGVEPLPQQLALGEISAECSAALWAVVFDNLQSCMVSSTIGYDGGPWLGDPWMAILRGWYITREYKMADEIGGQWQVNKDRVKAIITSQNYVNVFNFIQYVADWPQQPRRFRENIAGVLKATRSAYRMIEGVVVPISSSEQALAIQQALSIAQKAQARGPSSHLRAAAKALSAGDWVSSVRESIHGVEAAAKSIEPEAETLGPALARLKTSINLNPALASAFGKLYGFTSGGNGVRHSLVFEAVSDINERDAMFMFGACAAFVGFLLSASSEKQIRS